MATDHTTDTTTGHSTDRTDAPEGLLRISGECTIFRAAELRDLLMTDPALLEIDLSGVTEMDSAGLQLLMGVKLAATRQQRTLRLTGHSQAVLEVFELLNVAGFFDDPLVMGARK
jgi:anti-anti-sigma factor